MIAIRLLTTFVFVIACTITLGLVNTKNGILRKILIAYFAGELFQWGTLLYFAVKYDFTPFIRDILLLWLIPKALVKAIFYLHISKKRKGDDLVTK